MNVLAGLILFTSIAIIIMILFLVLKLFVNYVQSKKKEPFD